MTPSARLAALFVAAALLAGHAPAGDGAPPPRAAAKASIADRLAKRVSVEKFEGKFGDAVKLFRDTYDLPLTIDANLRSPDGGPPIEDTPVKLPAQANVRADTALRLLCEQVAPPNQNESGVTFLAQPDHVRLTGAVAALYETGILKPETNEAGETPLLEVRELQKARPLTQRALVTAAYKAKALADIVDEIGEATGANVVLAPQAADKAKQPLTVRFANTPVDAAVRTLCEMTDLAVIEDANVLLVTTRERADAKAKADEAKRKAKQADAGLPIGLGGGGGFGGFVGPDVSAELVKLREQNDALRKQLDEIQKQLKK